MTTRAWGGLLLLVVAGSGFDEPSDERDQPDYTEPYMYLSKHEEAFVKLGGHKTIPFQVDDKYPGGEKFKCALKRVAEVPTEANYGLVNYTVAQNWCYKRYKADMKAAKYDGYAGCIVDTYNRVANGTYHRFMKISSDNRTLFYGLENSQFVQARILMMAHHGDYELQKCRTFCNDLFDKLRRSHKVKLDGDEKFETAVVGPAINVLRQFRRCFGLSRLGDKYNWPQPRT